MLDVSRRFERETGGGELVVFGGCIHTRVRVVCGTHVHDGLNVPDSEAKRRHVAM